MTRERVHFVAPQLATLVTAAPTGPEWSFEIKYDGYRLEALIDAGRVRLLTRRGKDWTAKFPGIARRLSRCNIPSAILDGEVVVLDARGASQFSLLQQSLDGSRDDQLVYFVFDLLHLDGQSLRSNPQRERHGQLERLLRRARAIDRGAVRLTQRLDGTGPALIRAACEQGLEGIIGKRNDASYQSQRGMAWIKVKCGHRQEFVVIGYTPPRGARVGIGSLLLAVHDNGGLRYAGRVGSGFDDHTLRHLRARLATLGRNTTPLSTRPSGIPGSAHWVEPAMVVEVAFTEWTRDGLLRHPVFQGVREDKPPGQVRREEPVMSKPARPSNRRKIAAVDGDESIVAGVEISHPGRVVFPEAGLTKLDLARHFERVAPVLLPHVAGRPLSLVRCPSGSGGECFFQKHWTGKLPASLDTVPIMQSDGKKHPYVVIRDVAGLVTLAQWGVMEIHPWGAKADDPDRPDRIIFDLDPGPGVTWGDVRDATAGLHALLDAIGLDSWLKTSGGKGLHVELPIDRRSSWEEVGDFARSVAEHMQAEFPDRFIAQASKAARRGVIFVDWLRNTRGATAVAPWSPRARATAGVSVPLPWDRLASVTSGDQFTLKSVAAAPPTRDPWHDMLASRQRLTARIRKALQVAGART
jgi:bifunctional non-homologous end joining protein LigD